MAFGVTPAGFVPETLAQLQADIESDLQAQFGADIDLSATGPFGQLSGVIAGRLAPVWQLGQAVYNAFDPSAATDVALDNLCALTGTVRLGAKNSTFQLGLNPIVLVGTNGTVVPQGTIFATSGSSAKFSTDAAATIVTVTAYSAGLDYPIGSLVKNGSNVYVCSDEILVSATAPTGITTSVDGSGLWTFVAAASAAVVVQASATLTGAITAPAGTLTVIVTPVAGLTSVLNSLDAAQGRAIESDAALRIRRELELRAQGNAALDSVRGDVLEATGVTSCTVLQNDTDTDNTGSGGQPPHSIECIVLGGADAAVRTAILGSKAAGTRAYGTNALGTITDSQGNAQQIDFTRPTTLAIWIKVNGTKDATKFPSDGNAQIAQALVNYSLGVLLDATGNSIFPGYAPGDTVNAWNLVEAVQSVSGVKTITSILIGTVNPPTTSTDITTTSRQLAVFDTSRVLFGLV